MDEPYNHNNIPPPSRGGFSLNWKFFNLSYSWGHTDQSHQRLLNAHPDKMVGHHLSPALSKSKLKNECGKVHPPMIIERTCLNSKKKIVSYIYRYKF